MLDNINSIPSKLNQLLDKRRKFFIFILVLLAILLSLIETVGISIIMPFISVASNPETLNTGYYKIFYDLFEFNNPTNFIIVFGMAIIVFYFFRMFFNIFYNYAANKFSFGTYRYFASRLFKTYLALPYIHYVQKNPSILSQTIVVEANNLCNLLLSILHIFSELFVVLLLYFFMVFVNWQMTIVLTIILVFIVIIVFLTLIRTNDKLGEKRYEANEKLSKTIWQTFNNLKFIKLKGNEDELYSIFNDSTSKMSRTAIISNTISNIPKNILENLGFSLLITAVCYILWHYNSAAMVIPVITMYALALYRILPGINKILTDLNSIAYLQRSLKIVYDDLNLDTDKEGSEQISFNNNIRGEDLWFSYLNGGDVIKGISFEIRIGEKVAFTGESGSGKTTLVDIIIGIYPPYKGNLYIDNVLVNKSNVRSWRNKIGYIPQHIYLFDGSVAENIAFGTRQDVEKIIEVAKKAKIWDFLQTKDGINTVVGEGGIQLSGGQIQRIGIARALYNDPEVLVLDEATSSLDDATESQIMDEIYDMSGNKTLIIIAHRLSTVKRCEKRIYIEKGELR